MNKEQLETVLNAYRKFCIQHDVILSTYGCEDISIEPLNKEYSELDRHIAEIRDNTWFRLFK